MGVYNMCKKGCGSSNSWWWEEGFGGGGGSERPFSVFVTTVSGRRVCLGFGLVGYLVNSKDV